MLTKLFLICASVKLTHARD